jgi:MFS family permease
LPHARPRGHGHDASGRHRLTRGAQLNALRQFDASFWRYIASFSIFSFSVFIFQELYPLYLEAHGQGVTVIGNASLALNVGCIAGTVPAVLLMRWLGLKGTHLLSIVAVCIASALRLRYQSALSIYGFAFVSGFFFAVLTVGVAVTITHLTTASNRALGFSCFFVATIAAGFFGDAVGGEMPGLLEWAEHGAHHGERLFTATLFACAIGVSSIVPALRLRLAGEMVRQALRFPRGSEVASLVGAIAVWQFAVGLFAPFFALYFSSHLGASVRSIGLDLATGQVVGAVFTMFAPMWVNWWGSVRSIRFFMFTAGASAFFMTLTEASLASGIGYAIYTGYLAMVQPPLNTLLMNAVKPDEQAGASMASSLFGFSAVAAGGYVGGQLIDLLGWPQMLALAGAACMAAAVAFVVLVKPEGPPARLRTAEAA